MAYEYDSSTLLTGHEAERCIANLTDQKERTTAALWLARHVTIGGHASRPTDLLTAPMERYGIASTRYYVIADPVGRRVYIEKYGYCA